MNFLDFGRFLAGAAREKSSNCVSPSSKYVRTDGAARRPSWYQFSEILLQIQSPEALQILGLAIQNRQSKIQN